MISLIKDWYVFRLEERLAATRGELVRTYSLYDGIEFNNYTAGYISHLEDKIGYLQTKKAALEHRIARWST